MAMPSKQIETTPSILLVPSRSSMHNDQSIFLQGLKKIRIELTTVVGFSFMSNLLMLVIPIYTIQVFDRVLASGSLETLFYLTLIAIVSLGVYGLLEHVRHLIMNRTGAWLESVLGPALIGAGLRARLRGAEGEAQPALRNLAEVRGFLTGEGMLALIDAPWTPIFIAVIWIMHPILGLIAIGGALALLGCAIFNDLLTRPAMDAAQRDVQESERWVGEAMANAEAARALGMCAALIEHWRVSCAEGSRSLLQASDRAAMVISLARFLRLSLQIAIIGAGAYLVIGDKLTAGGMIAGSILLSRALGPTERSIAGWRSFVSARSSHRALKNFLCVRTWDLGSQEPVAATDASDPLNLPRPRARLTVHELAFAPWGANNFTLRLASFTTEPGEVCAVIGLSGAGKSTLARLITGAWTPSRGEVRLDGAALAHWDGDELGRYLGYLPQEVQLFSGTVAQNIARLRHDVPIEAVIKAAKVAGAHETILRLPRGYATDIGQGGHRLSGGQRQRVGLARALFGDPVLVVLDEPSANLDREGTEALVRAVLAIKAQGSAVVLITHQPSLLRAADRILVLHAGVGVLFGSSNEVLAALKEPKVGAVQDTHGARARWQND